MGFKIRTVQEASKHNAKIGDMIELPKSARKTNKKTKEEDLNDED